MKRIDWIKDKEILELGGGYSGLAGLVVALHGGR
jgi:predicted nicotinamide N-methyase